MRARQMGDTARGAWLRRDVAEEMLIVERWAKHMGVAEYRAALQVASDRAAGAPEGTGDPGDRLFEFLVWMSAIAVARTTDNPNPKACSFCARDSNAVKRLVAGPDVIICDVCVGEAIVAFKDIEGRVAPSKKRCCFCNQKSKAVGAMYARGEARICKSCTDVSQDVIERDRGAA
jgi:hypothetical protein